MTRRLVALAILLAWLGSVRTAMARETVGLFRVDIDGVSKTAADKFERSIEEGLSGTGFKVANRKALRDALKGTDYVAGCYFGACLKEIYKRTRVRLILVARITSAGPNYNFVVSLLDTRTGLPTSQVADRCTVCTLEEAIASATLAVVALATGTGTAAVTDPVSGPTRSTQIPLLRAEITRLGNEVRQRRRSARNARITGWVFLGLAAVAGGIGVMQVRSCDDRKDVSCWMGAGIGGALGFTGISILVLSP